MNTLQRWNMQKTARHALRVDDKPPSKYYTASPHLSKWWSQWTFFMDENIPQSSLEMPNPQVQWIVLFRFNIPRFNYNQHWYLASVRKFPVCPQLRQNRSTLNGLMGYWSEVWKLYENNENWFSTHGCIEKKLSLKRIIRRMVYFYFLASTTSSLRHV